MSEEPPASFFVLHQSSDGPSPVGAQDAKESSQSQRSSVEDSLVVMKGREDFGSANNSTSTTNVFVTGLPIDFDEIRLRALFSVYGDIFSCKIMVDIDSGVSLGFGFVRYVDPSNAQKAIDAMHGKKLNSSCPRAMSVSLARNDGTVTVTESERVYVRNVPSYSTDNDVRRVFSEYGDVIECKIQRHPGENGREGRSKGVAFVRYRTIEEAQLAVLRGQGTRPFPALDGSYAKPIMVRFAETHEAREHRKARQEKEATTRTATQQPVQTLTYEDPVTGYTYTTTITPPPPGWVPQQVQREQRVQNLNQNAINIMGTKPGLQPGPWQMSGIPPQAGMQGMQQQWNLPQAGVQGMQPGVWQMGGFPGMIPGMPPLMVPNQMVGPWGGMPGGF